jgi:hypothetical protein
MDWRTWHDAYDRPDSNLALRLRFVQDQIRTALDTAPAGPLRAISMCAGQGRDLIGVLADHPRAGDVTARLVEWDEANAADARQAAAAAGLDRVGVVCDDAASTVLYADLVPADLVLVCGVFGNITDADVYRTIDHCPQLCATGGTLVWTRHRKEPDLVPLICDRLESRGFERLTVSDADQPFGAGAHRFTGQPEPLVSTRLFSFVGYDVLDPSTSGTDGTGIAGSTR